MSHSQKISSFNTQSILAGTDLFTLVRNSTNVNVSFSDFKSSLGVTGTLNQVGDPLGAPTYESPAAGINNFRNIESSNGIVASLSAQNGVMVSTSFVNGAGGVPIIEDLNADTFKFRSIAAGSDIVVGQSNGSIVISAVSGSSGSNIIVVNSVADFPTPVLGVITLEDETIYLISSKVVDIGVNKIKAGLDSTIAGTSVLTNILRSSATGDFIFADKSFEIRNLSVDCPNATVINFVAPTPVTSSVIVDKVAVVECDKIISSKNHNILLVTNFNVLKSNTGGFLIDGDCGFMSLSTMLLSGVEGTVIDLGTSTNLSVNIENTSIITVPLSLVFDGLPNSGNIKPGGSGALNKTDIIGSFTSAGNILPSDILWRTTSSNVLADSKNFSLMVMPTNASVTVISTINTPVKINGVWTVKAQSRFTGDTTGKVTYVGVNDIQAKIDVSTTFQKSGNGVDNFNLYVAKNGVPLTESIATFASDNSRDPNISLSTSVSLSTNDFIELYIESTDDTNDIRMFAANIVVS